MGTSRWKAATNRRGTLRMVECRRLIRFLSNCFLLGLVGLMCGCVTENIQGQTRTFSFETWMPLSATIVSLTVLGVACCWRRARKLWGGSLLVIPVLIIITFVPELPPSYSQRSKVHRFNPLQDSLRFYRLPNKQRGTPALSPVIHTQRRAAARSGTTTRRAWRPWPPIG